MENIAWDFLGKTLLFIFVYCIIIVILAAIWLPLTIIWTILGILFINKICSD